MYQARLRSDFTYALSGQKFRFQIEYVLINREAKDIIDWSDVQVYLPHSVLTRYHSFHHDTAQ